MTFRFPISLMLKGLQTWNNYGSGPVQKGLRAIFEKLLLQTFFFNFMLEELNWRKSNNIWHFITFNKETCWIVIYNGFPKTTKNLKQVIIQVNITYSVS